MRRIFHEYLRTSTIRPKSIRQCGAVLGLLTMGLAGNGTAAASNAWTFEVLADSTSGYSSFYRSPVLNCRADVAVIAATDRGAGLFRINSGSVTPIHETADMEEYGQPAINDSGTVLFGHKSSATAVGPRPNPARLLMGDGATLNEVADGIRRSGHGGDINNLGTVAYPGSMKSGRDRQQGVVLDNGQQSRVIVDLGTGPIKGIGPTSIDVNDNGTVVLVGDLRDGTHGLFSVNANGLVKLLDTSSGIDRFIDVHINNSGDIAFNGYVKIDERRQKFGLYLLRNGEVENIGGDRFQWTGGPPNLNDAGVVVFQAMLNPDGRMGLFVGPDPDTDRVIAVGERVGGKTISEIRLAENALNNVGQIVFHAKFDDGSDGIVLATPGPDAPIATLACDDTGQPMTLVAQAPDPGPAGLDHLVGESGWIIEQRKVFRQLLASREYDALVAPFQPDGDTLDAVGRTLLARRLADSLERAGDFVVADPGLVEKALGEPARNVSPDTVLALARELGVGTVVIGAVGHDRQNHFHVRLDVWSGLHDGPDSGEEKRELVWRDLTFSDTELPYDKFAAVAEEAAGQITGTTPGKVATSGAEAASYPSLPGSFDELASRAARSPLDEARYLAFIATLFPVSVESRSRDHLFERALIALDRVHAHVSGRAELRARSLMALNRRPAALSALGESRTPQARALRAYLNADLPALTSAVGEIPDAESRLMAEMDLQHLRFSYNWALDGDRAEALMRTYPVWGPFLLSRYVDGNPWGAGSQAVVKLALDNLMPGVFTTLERFVQGQESRGVATTEPELASSVLAHVAAGYGLTAPGSLAGRSNATAPQQSDILSLAQTTTLRNAIAASRAERMARGRYRRAWEMLSDYDGIFFEHPRFVLEQSEARRIMTMERNLSGEQRAALLEESTEIGRKGFVWYGGQTELTLRISEEPETWFPEADAVSASQRGRVFYSSDFPARFGTDLPPLGATGVASEAAVKRCLDYTLINLGCAVHYHQGLVEQTPPKTAEAERLLESLETRFVGHPSRDTLIAAMRQRMGEQQTEVEMIRAALREGSPDPYAYLMALDEMVRQGEYSEALDTVLQFPGLGTPNAMDGATLSGFLYQAGSRLYWTGAWEEALPLYDIAAAQQSGSDAELASASRLALLDRDWPRAAEVSLTRARRYDSAYAYRDYMALLHMQGLGDESWALFDNLLNDGSGIQIWTAAYLGHRISNASLQDIVDWVTDGARGYKSSPQIRTNDQIVRYLMLTSTIDRLPDESLGDMIRDVDPRWQGYVPPPRDPVSDPDTGDEIAFLMPHERMPIIADAMAAFYRNNMAGAQALLDQAGALRDLNEHLYHYAVAARATGRSARLGRYLDSAQRRYQEMPDGPELVSWRFHDHLAFAVVAGLRGDHDIAIDHLTRAVNDRPFTEYRTMFTFYQILEAYEFLHGATAEDAYRSQGYDLAVRFQTIQPMYPWAYAVAARLAPSGPDRVRHLASTMVLDPGSLRISMMTAEDRAQAREWLRINGSPFDSDHEPRLEASLNEGN